MKICPNCGKEANNDIMFCGNCGYNFGATPNAPYNNDPVKDPVKGEFSGLSKVAWIFMTISTIVMAICTYGIALAWCLPMRSAYKRKIQNNEPVSTGFKVCTLLFVSTVSGILMLCDREH